MKTKVIFRKLQGDIIALFPELAGDSQPASCLSYMHIGQHGAAYASPLGKPAKPEEYRELYKELVNIGYDLEVIQRFTYKHYLTRREQIK